MAVHPLPNLSNNPKSQFQCNNLNTNITLTSTIPGTQFTWTCTPSSPNITGWSNNLTPTTLLDQTLINSGFSVETVTYSITPQLNGCSGIITDYIVTVSPTPNLSNNPQFREICSGQSTGITLTSNTQNTLFTWTCSQPSGNVTGWTANSGPATNILNQTLILSGVITDSVIYHITPQTTTCTGGVTDYKVYVNAVPQVTVLPMFDSICSEETTNIQLTATCAGTTFTWTSAQGAGNVTGNTNGNTNLITDQLFNPLNTAGSILYTIIPATSSCTGNDTVFTMWVKPLPHLTNQPKGDSLCNGQPTALTLQSDVTNTWFTWTATGSSLFVSVTRIVPSPGTFINQTLINSGVVYRVGDLPGHP